MSNILRIGDSAGGKARLIFANVFYLECMDTDGDIGWRGLRPDTPADARSGDRSSAV